MTDRNLVNREARWVPFCRQGSYGVGPVKATNVREPKEGRRSRSTKAYNEGKNWSLYVLFWWKPKREWDVFELQSEFKSHNFAFMEIVRLPLILLTSETIEFGGSGSAKIFQKILMFTNVLFEIFYWVDKTLYGKDITFQKPKIWLNFNLINSHQTLLCFVNLSLHFCNKSVFRGKLYFPHIQKNLIKLVINADSSYNLFSLYLVS